MSLAELPHSRGCVVCGYDNPHGLHVRFTVDTERGEVSTTFVPRSEHIGFINIVHGGVIATILDEAMVWAATWAGHRFCVCAEMTVRFRRSASVGQNLSVKARVVSRRSRLIETEADITDEAGEVIAIGIGKYTPVPPERNREVVQTLVDEPAVDDSFRTLKDAAEGR